MKNKIRAGVKWIAFLQITWLCGCVSSVALRHDYNDYSEVYGDAVNKQLLLNLARESRQDPVYFLQLGTINSQYQFTTSAGFSPTAVRTTPSAAAGLVQHTLTLGGTVSAGATQSPQFQFLPLNGSNYVSAVMSPISDKVFLTFYDQGWPANWVVRTMVDSIEIATNINISTNIPVSINGSPQTIATNYIQTNITVYVNDPVDPTYPEFLNYCDQLRDAQLYKMLIVDKVPGEPKTVFSNTNSKLSDVVSAIGAGLSVVCDSNKVITVKTKPDATLKLVANKYSNYDDYRHFGTPFTSAKTFVTNFSKATVEFKPRTFEAVMNSIAAEEGEFRWLTTNKLNTNGVVFTHDACGPIAVVSRTNDGQSVYQFTNRPIMRITYTDKERSGLSKLIEVEYKNTMYSVGDFTNVFEDVSQYDTDQNRAVFTMLSYLFSQTAIDTQKLPVQQLIQVQ